MKTSINSSNTFFVVFCLALCRFLESTTFDLSDEVVAAVNCGGETQRGAYGIVYKEDVSNAGSASNHGMQYAFMNVDPSDAPIYQTERWSESSFEYNFDVKDNGLYVIMLKFSEVYFKKPSEKVFDVSINDYKVLENLDIFHAAGGIGQGYDVYVQIKIAGNDIHIEDHVQKYYGNIKVEFLKGAADNPKINAIAIIRGKVDEMPPPPKPILNQEDDEDDDHDSDIHNAHQNHHEQEYEETYEEYSAPSTSQEEQNPFERELDFKYIAVILIVIIFIPLYYFNRNQQA